VEASDVRVAEIGGAGISVIAAPRKVNASSVAVADVQGAGVSIFAVLGGPGSACAVHAEIRHRTGVSVLAFEVVCRGVEASRFIAEVQGARVSVVTVQWGSDAFCGEAMIVGGAEGSIITVIGIGGVRASDAGVAGIDGAGIEVVALGGGTDQAFALEAGIVDGAEIPVFTWKVVGQKRFDAAHERVAFAQGTGLLRAFDGRALALSIRTRVAVRTEASVFAGSVLLE